MKTISMLLSMLIILSIWISPACSIPIGAAKGEAQTQQPSALPSEQSLQATFPSSQAQTPTPPGDANVILEGTQNTHNPEIPVVILGKAQVPSGYNTSVNSFTYFGVRYGDNALPVIFCFSGQNEVGYINFYPDGSKPSYPDFISEGNIISISYPLSKFHEVLDMLLRFTNGTSSLFIHNDLTGGGLIFSSA